MGELISWRKASRSSVDNGCVEVGTALGGRAVAIRDSKSPERGHITITPTMLRALLASVKRGELD
jgi:hypothetical protein